MSEVAFVCVAYETPQFLKSFVNQVLESPARDRVRLLAVDNSAEADPALAERLRGHATASYFHTGQNLGYFGAARFALERLRERGELPAWIVICNVDLQLDTGGFADSLAALATDESVGAVAPRLISQATGQEMNPFFRYRPTAFRMWFLSAVFRFYPVLQVYHWLAHIYHSVRSRISTRTAEALPVTRVERIYAPHGAIFTLARSYFDRGGTLDHGVFLFGEEITIAERVRDLGLTTVFDRGCLVHHQDSASTGHVRSRRIGRFMHEAAAFSYETYFRKRRVADR